MTQNVISLHATEETRELGDILERMDHGDPDPEEVKAVRRYLAKHPGVAADVAGLGRIAADRVIANFSDSATLTELIKAEHRELVQELGAANATPLEQLLIEQVALCWVRLQEVEFKHSNVVGSSRPISQAEYWERRLNATQRRFLRAATALARIRKIELPAMQVNIGQQQVNQVNAP